MFKVWIVEEKISSTFLNELEHHMRLKGELDTAYFVSADGEGYGEGYGEGNKNFLLEFLLGQNNYPLFLTFIVSENQTDDYVAFLNEKKIEFSLSKLEEKRTYYDFQGKHDYHPSCFAVRIKDAASLALLLNETYGLAQQNDFLSISFSDNLLFELEEVMEWKRKQKRSIATFKIEMETTFITITHDGAGFYLFSNEKKYFPVQNFVLHLPKGTILTQINDTLITDNNKKEE